MKPADFARHGAVFLHCGGAFAMPRNPALHDDPVPQHVRAFNLQRARALGDPGERRVSRDRRSRQDAAGRRQFGLRVALTLSAGVLAVFIAGVSAAQGGLPAPQTANGVEYVTGGFGDDMAQAFKSAQQNYPLALTFAEDAGGGSRPYLAEVDVSIKDQSGATVLEVPSTGPYFLAKLKPGQYRVEATHMGRMQTQNVTVGEGGSASHVISWKAQ